MKYFITKPKYIYIIKKKKFFYYLRASRIRL